MKIKRLMAAIIDHFIVCIIVLVVPILTELGPSAAELLLYVMPPYVALMIIKDIPPLCLGKRVLGLEIIDLETGKSATVKQRILRNITILIWPIEIIVMLASSNGRRLADNLLKTGVQEIS